MGVGKDASSGGVLPLDVLWGYHAEPIAHHLLNPFMLFRRDRAHVTHGVPGVPNESGLRDERFVADERLKVIFPVVVLVHDTEQLRQRCERQFAPGVEVHPSLVLLRALVLGHLIANVFGYRVPPNLLIGF